MNAIAEACTEHTALQEAYKEALHRWAEARAVVPPDSAEVRAATLLIEELERLLQEHRSQHGC
jgi:hypothetical protein